MLLAYFDEPNSRKCGVCDVCLEEKRQKNADEIFDNITHEIVQFLRISTPDIGTLINTINIGTEKEKMETIRLLLDAGKGAASVLAVFLISRLWNSGYPLRESDAAIRAALAGFFAVLGHMFPAWLRFKGGKGVATALGSFVLIAPKATLVMIGVFAFTLLAFRFVSLGSVIAVALFPLPVWLLREYHDEPLVLTIIAAASIMIVLKHHANIRRLILGTEPHFQLRHG